jgi:hypothetical protein
LLALHPAFSREATFEWFVVLFWGAVLNRQPPAVTSYLNAVGLGESYYYQALHWFHSSAFCVDSLCAEWGEWLSEHRFVTRLGAQRLYVGDGIKVGKEGRNMPGVKGVHQESSDVNKPERIRGAYSKSWRSNCPKPFGTLFLAGFEPSPNMAIQLSRLCA